MGKVVIRNLYGKSIDCETKTKSLLDILLKETDWMHACGKKGRCTTCKCRVLDGGDVLSERTDSEKKFERLRKLKSDERLTCQTTLVKEGTVTIEATDENKLPHIAYGE